MADKKLYVQANRSVTSLKGIIPEGDEISSKMLKGGEKSIEGLLKKEVIGEKKPDLRTKAEIVREREAKKLAEKNKKASEPAKAGGAEKK